MSSDASIPGDELARYLDRDELTSPTRVDPPPATWAALKPSLLRAVRRARARATTLPPFTGYPLCAIGNEYRELPVSRRGEGTYHPACQICQKREQCSPPAAWSPELQPFGPADPIRLWDCYHARLTGVLRVSRDRALDDLVALLVRPFAGPLRRQPCTLEPSVLFAEALLPSIRLVVFQGELPGDRGAAIGVTEALIDTFAALHVQAGGTVPARLLDCLMTRGPFPMPMGFETTAGGVLLKAYIRLEQLPISDRRELVLALASLFRNASTHELPWERVEMIGLATLRGELVSLKVYVAADPSRDQSPQFPGPVAEDHLLMQLSEQRAYAVVDIEHTDQRAPKWDFYLRERLLSGPMLGPTFGPLLGTPAASQLGQIFDHHEFRCDCVAAALRGDVCALYLELG